MLKQALSDFRESSSSSMVSSSVNGKKDVATLESKEQKVNGKGLRITIADTNKTKPVVMAEKTGSTELEPGDILLMSSMKVPGTINKLVRAGSTATQGGLNHAAIYTGKGNIVEGRINRGVTELSLDRGTKGLSYTVVRPNLPKKVRNNAARVAREQIGKKYNDGDLLRTGALLGLVPDRLRASVVGETNTTSIDKLDSMQCAALIAGAYQKAGKQITNLNYRYVAPVDLLSKTDSTIIKMKKQRGDVTQGTPSTFTASAREAKNKLNAYMSKTASDGLLKLFCHVDATDWCPNGDLVDRISPLFNKEVSVSIFPRYLVSKVWEEDHPGQTYDKDYYAFRAYAGRDYCKIFVDETETKDSVLWVMLHELAHISLASAPYLFKAYRHLTAPDYFESDEAHENDPEEQMANTVAMAGMDILGYGKVSYPRYWWRERTMQNKNKRFPDLIQDPSSMFADPEIVKEASLKSTLIGSGLGSALAGGNAALGYGRSNATEDYMLDRSGNPLTEEQLQKRKKFQRGQIGRSALKGGVLGGLTGFGMSKAKKALIEGRDEVLNTADKVVGKGRAFKDEALKDVVSTTEDVLKSGKETAEKFTEEAIKKGKEAVDSTIEGAIDKGGKKAKEVLDETLYGKNKATTVANDPHAGGVFGQLDETIHGAIDRVPLMRKKPGTAVTKTASYQALYRYTDKLKRGNR